MIIDSSALLAIILREPESVRFVKAIGTSPVCRMSAASYVEVALKLDRDAASIDPALDELIAALGIVLEPVTPDHARMARAAFHNFGKGRHPAGLNFGDCLTYALAKATGEPLLFKGGDFGLTDLAPV